uniref:WH1 domain-containing protein n=1 Tax=Strongyloides papillosus TaxID=174720 RepID=A0A0N5CC99_STREA
MKPKDEKGDFTKMNSGKKRIMNNGSMLLTLQENEELFNLLDIDEYSICCGICRIFKTNKHFSPGWEMIGDGVVVYTKDYSKKLYSLKLFCLTTKKCVWEYILHTNFMPVFGFERIDTLEFESKGSIYCINFSNHSEAQLFYTLFKKKFERDDKRQLINGKKITENDIPSSSEFSYLNMDCTKSDKVSNINSNNKIIRDTDQSVKELLEAAGFDYLKIKEKDLKFARTFVEEYEKRKNESKAKLVLNNGLISPLSNIKLEDDNFKMIPTSFNEEEVTTSNKTLPIPPPLPPSTDGKRNNISKNSDNFRLSSNNDDKCIDLMEQIKHGKKLKHVDDTVKLQQSSKEENSTDLNTSLTEALRKVMNERRRKISESDSSSSSTEDWN